MRGQVVKVFVAKCGSQFNQQASYLATELSVRDKRFEVVSDPHKADVIVAVATASIGGKPDGMQNSRAPVISFFRDVHAGGSERLRKGGFRTYRDIVKKLGRLHPLLLWRATT